MKLRDKVAIVTAAGRGIGRGIALCLAEEGANVVVNSFHEENTNKVAEEIRAMGRKALVVAGDITTPAKIQEIAEKTVDTFGKIDILVSNVGGHPMIQKETDDSLMGKLESEWDGLYTQNLRASVLICQTIATYFIKQKSGKIVTIASAAGRNTNITTTSSTSYRAVKAGLIRYTQSLSDELGPHNINVNCICPGFVYTDVWQRNSARMVETRPEYKGLSPREWFVSLNEGKRPEIAPPTPLRREQTPEDMGRAVVFLVSEDSKNITGQTLNVDGGRLKN